MLRLRSSTGHGPADLLGDLPHGYHCLAVGPGHLVVGPTGVFVVADGGRNPRTVARDLAQWASRFRATVAELLSWAPFVDVLVVVDRVRTRLETASVVRADMLVDALVSGPRLLPVDTVDRLADLAAEVIGGGPGERTAP